MPRISCCSGQKKGFIVTSFSNAQVVSSPGLCLLPRQRGGCSRHSSSGFARAPPRKSSTEFLGSKHIQWKFNIMKPSSLFNIKQCFLPKNASQRARNKLLKLSLVLLHPVEEDFQNLSQLVHCCHVDRRLHQGHYATSLRTEKRFHSKPVFGNEK